MMDIKYFQFYFYKFLKKNLFLNSIIKKISLRAKKFKFEIMKIIKIYNKKEARKQKKPQIQKKRKTMFPFVFSSKIKNIKRMRRRSNKNR